MLRARVHLARQNIWNTRIKATGKLINNRHFWCTGGLIETVMILMWQKSHTTHTHELYLSLYQTRCDAYA